MEYIIPKTQLTRLKLAEIKKNIIIIIIIIIIITKRKLMVHRLKMNWRFFLGNNTERTDLINGRLLLNMFEDSLAK